MSRDMLIGCFETSLFFELVSLGHSALSGCSFFWSWFDSAGMVFSGGVESFNCAMARPINSNTKTETKNDNLDLTDCVDPEAAAG
jgi:hypothetical protein